MDLGTILSFSYDMKLTYEEPITREHFTIKAIPVSNHRQKISEVSVRLTPNANASGGTDSFGNHMIYGSIQQEHSYFHVSVTGKAKIIQVLYEEEADEDQVPIFRHPYGRNRPGEHIRTYFHSIRDQLEENAYVNAVYLMRRLHQDFRYQPGITNIKTTAEEAFCLGCGVCQDYAHLYLALCHLAGIPARYVTGLIVGEGESHAWAEILYRGRWIGMDPTNDLLVNGSYIKFGHGRDSSDCLINRGIFRGSRGQTQQIKVTVNEERNKNGKNDRKGSTSGR